VLTTSSCDSCLQSNSGGIGNTQAAAAEELSSPCTITHAVGLGYGKQKKLQELWLKQQPDAAVLKQKLQQRKLPFISNTCEASRMSHIKLLRARNATTP
jgi:hypothetical protein